jgi:hypothetical protein
MGTLDSANGFDSARVRNILLRSAMTRAEEYRQRAKEAEENAKKTDNPDTKQGFLDLARQWRELADQGRTRRLVGRPVGEEPCQCRNGSRH